ncbi:MAG: addiction module family protein [Bacteroidetes bacterium]|jgi:hypothetical protein|nr:addiction module family protein [Bacteroidota bacterium]
METTIDIRKKIHEFIDHADERILRIFNGIINAEKVEKEIEPMVPESFYKKLDVEREQHLKGESKSYTWEDVKGRLTKTYGL